MGVLDDMAVTGAARRGGGAASLGAEEQLVKQKVFPLRSKVENFLESRERAR